MKNETAVPMNRHHDLGVVSLTETSSPVMQWAFRKINAIKAQFGEQKLHAIIGAYRDDGYESIDFVVWAGDRNDYLDIVILIGTEYDYNDNEPTAPSAFDALDMISLITTPLALKCSIARQHN